MSNENTEEPTSMGGGSYDPGDRNMLFRFRITVSFDDHEISWTVFKHVVDDCDDDGIDFSRMSDH